MNHFSIRFCFGIWLVFPDLRSIKSRFNRLFSARNEGMSLPAPDV